MRHVRNGAAANAYILSMRHQRTLMSVVKHVQAMYGRMATPAGREIRA